jgi:HEAT repeat protein
MLGAARAPTVEKRLPSGTDAKRAEGALKLAEQDSPASVAALSEALSDTAPEVRAAAALALASLRDPASIAALAEIVADWDDPPLARCRRAALQTLTAFRGQEAAIVLARALATVRPERPVGLEEHSALLAVAYAEPAGAAAPLVVRALVPLLAHDEDAVAERAASLLALFPAEGHGPLARTLRLASAPAVRRRAATALGACRQGAAVTALVAALRDSAAEVRAAAARSLGNMRDPATVGALEAAGGDADETVRGAARSALRKVGAVASAPHMAASLGVLAQRTPG